MSFYAILQRPQSVGSLTIRSSDPLRHPALDPAYFSDASNADLDTMIEGVAFCRHIASQKALAALDLREITPSREAQTKEQIGAFVRGHCQSIYHPASTCRMGRDANAVVDPATLKVHGVEGLRVADASVFPDLVASNICASVFMVAERAASFIDVIETE